MQLNEEELKKKLGEERYYVLREKETETPFTGIANIVGKDPGHQTLTYDSSGNNQIIYNYGSPKTHHQVQN